MKSRIQCAARDCIHNISGKCASELVQVQEYVDERTIFPYCETFVTDEKALVIPTLTAMRAHHAEMGAEQDWPSSGGPRGSQKMVPHETIACAVFDCIHYKDSYCQAGRIDIDAPVLPGEGGTLCHCNTYTRKY